MNEKLKEILETSLYFLAVLVIALLVVTFIGQRTIVDGSSMEPTLSDKDNLIVDKITYRFKEPQRFDVVVFPYKGSKRTYYIKRIIGLPGETVQILDDGTILINNEALDEKYGNDVIKKAGRASSPITLGEDEYFVMGDNRNNSQDSRFEDVGNIKKSDLTGRAWMRIFPFKKFGMVKNIRKDL